MQSENIVVKLIPTSYVKHIPDHNGRAVQGFGLRLVACLDCGF
jgi:hypothetical protein